jgi:hypothetical protein
MSLFGMPYRVADAVQETIASEPHVWDLTTLGLRLYIRSQGFVGSPEEFLAIDSIRNGTMRFMLISDSARFPL